MQLTTSLISFQVNKKAYARLDMIVKGGSSRVFRVLNHANELYAIKRVSLDKTDAETMSGYMNEIALLKRLEGNSRIIRLIDSEVKAGPGGSKGHLLLVMECGEIDLARLLAEQMKDPLNMVWVAYYWQQVRVVLIAELIDIDQWTRCYKPCMLYMKRRLYTQILSRRTWSSSRVN